MRKLLILILPILLTSQTLKPHREFKANGLVYDFIISENILYSATGVGEIDIFSLKSGEIIDIVKVPTIPNFYEDNLPAKIYSIDKFENRLLILSEAEYGGRTIFLQENGKLRKILSSRSPIKKARFINDVLFLYATLGNELILYDIWNNREIYKKQVNSSPFSDFDIFEEEVAVACESGNISIHNIWTGDEVEILKGENLDNVYRVAFEKDIVLGSGQDRQVSIYNRNGKNSNIKGDFLIYSVGLSPDSKIGAFPFNQENDIRVFNVENGNILHTLVGQRSTLNTMEFQNSETLFTSSNDEYILEWKLR